MRSALRRAAYVAPALALAACAGWRGTTRRVALDTPFDVARGETVAVAESPARLTVASIAESRCPSDVTCITAGEAVVTLQLEGGPAPRTDTLRTSSPPRSIVYADVRIALLDVLPYPRSTDRDRVSVARLRVERP